MNIFHQELLVQLKLHQGKGTSQSSNDSYINSGHFYYNIAVPIRRTIVRSWIQKHKEITSTELLEVVTSLYRGRSHEEKSLASMLLGYLPRQRATIPITYIDTWLTELNGWAEVDSLCQSVFTDKELLNDWENWENLIEKFCKDNNINKRRASLVLLTSPVTTSPDKKLANLSFAIIEALKQEKHILVTKAISWLLRSLTKYHKKEVSAYLENNEFTLPAIAVRETKRKIQTGRK